MRFIVPVSVILTKSLGWLCFQATLASKMPTTPEFPKMQVKLSNVCCVCLTSIKIKHNVPRTSKVKPAVVCSSHCVQYFECVQSFLQGFMLCELLHILEGRPLPFRIQSTLNSRDIQKEYRDNLGPDPKPDENQSKANDFAAASTCDITDSSRNYSKSHMLLKKKRPWPSNLKHSVKTLHEADHLSKTHFKPPLKKRKIDQTNVSKNIGEHKQKRMKIARKNMRQRKSVKENHNRTKKTRQKDLPVPESVVVESTDSEGNPCTRKLYKCQMCPKTFIHKCNLRYHIKRMHSGEDPVKCESCGLMLQGSYDLLQHTRRVHESYLVCDICGAQFTTSCGLKSHLEAHAGVKSNFCDICGKGFVRKTSLTQHRLLHVEGKSFLCDVCSQAFKTRSSLSGHLLNVHTCGPYFENRVKSLEKMGFVIDRNIVARHTRQLCLNCGEKLEDGKCQMHPEVVQDSLFKCSKCGPAERDFKDIVAFDIHMKWHYEKVSHSGRKADCGWKTGSGTKEKPLVSGEFKCDVCSKIFKSRTYLWAHMNQHKDKRFSCDICGRKFTYKCNLKSHLITHQESRPFECDVCNKAFKMKSLLASHKILHGAPSPFKCEICGKGLTRKQNLKSHYKIMHPETQQRAFLVTAQSRSEVDS